MAAFDNIARNQVRKLARRGKLVDTCFKMFQQQVYPGATPEQISTMRICFFAGTAELFAVMTAGMDDGTAETEADLAFMDQWVEEIETFHATTIAAMNAGETKH